MSQMQFTTDNTLKLIHLYRENECLWKITSKLYRRSDLKNTALKKIADEFNVTIEDIKRKIRNLRNTYVQQKKNLFKDKKSGSGVDDLPKPKWFLFDELTFLDEVIVLRTTTNNFEVNEENTCSINNSWDIAFAQEAEPEEVFECTSESYQGNIKQISENIKQTHKTVTKGAEKIDKYDAAIAKLYTSTSPKQTN